MREAAERLLSPQLRAVAAADQEAARELEVGLTVSYRPTPRGGKNRQKWSRGTESMRTPQTESRSTQDAAERPPN